MSYALCTRVKQLLRGDPSLHISKLSLKSLHSGLAVNKHGLELELSNT